ncbi:serine hydrolase [Leptolyngbya sp. ST-U4]|uniref:serine hydrolase n=1 Tax=Leptolyngbya sp. ST-U4 TaxID=2933912 RepID=UPI0019A421FA|nr:serine hydrolase [Cyanobacteria bacterium FACHB-502]
MLEPSYRPQESQRRRPSRRRSRRVSPASASEVKSEQSTTRSSPAVGFNPNRAKPSRPSSPARSMPARPNELSRRSQIPADPALDSVPGSQSRRTRKPHPKRRPTPPLMQGIRLLILGVGIWAIAGTALSIWEPTVRSAQANQENVASGSSNAQAAPANTSIHNAFKPGQEMTTLAARIQPLTKDLTDLAPGVFLADLDSGNYYSLNGTTTFAAASMIKVPLLIAFFQDVDAGKIRLDEMLTMQQNDIATGSGDMQYLPVGSEFTALETATNMIVISDNTATNMILRRLGGIEAVNQRFKEWGLEQTTVRNVLPDLEGTNTTSPKELAAVMSLLSQGELLSMKSRDRAIAIMQGTLTDTLLPTSLGAGATIAHKTGDIGSLVGDTGLIDMPSGKRYAITAMVKRPHNDDRAQELIRQIAATVYDYLDQPTAQTAAAPISSTAPAEATTPESNPDALNAAPSEGGVPASPSPTAQE